MESRPGAEVAALEDEHVRPAELGQVVGDAAAAHAAADDDDAGLRGQRIGTGAHARGDAKWVLGPTFLLVRGKL